MYRRFVGASHRRGASRRERGQGLVEYALILVLVAVVVIVILALVGPAIGGVFQKINCAIRSSNPACVSSGGGGLPVGDTVSAQLERDGFCTLHAGSPYFQYWDGNHGYFITFTTDQGNPVNTFGPGSVLYKSGTCP